MSEVAYREGAWRAPSSQRVLWYRLWQPQAVRQLLVVLHGFGEHGGRYERLALELARHQLCVASADLWGHGRSGGARGDLGSIAQSVRELQELTQQMFLPQSGRSSYVLFGHSFGGLAAIVWALQAPVALRRLIVQSPLLEAGFPIPSWKTTAVTLLARCWPTFRFAMHLDADALSHDPDVTSAYRADPLVHQTMSARTYHDLLRTRDDAMARAGTLHLPTLLLCAGEDRIVSTVKAREWLDRVSCEKRCVVFPNAYHELHHEPVRDEVARLIRDWALIP